MPAIDVNLVAIVAIIAILGVLVTGAYLIFAQRNVRKQNVVEAKPRVVYETAQPVVSAKPVQIPVEIPVQKPVEIPVQKPVQTVQPVVEPQITNSPIRLSREDVIHYITAVSPHRNQKIEILRRKGVKKPDIVLINHRVAAIIFEKNRVLKFYFRTSGISGNNGNVKELPGGFYQRIITVKDVSKQPVYKEIDKALAFAAELFAADIKLLAQLEKKFDAAVETDSFRKDPNYIALIKEKNKYESAYFKQNGPVLGVTRDNLLQLIDKNANPDQTRTEINPEFPNKAITVRTKRPFVKLYQTKTRFRINAYINYEYAIDLQNTHTLIYKTGKTGSWYTIIVDGTFKNITKLFEITQRAKECVNIPARTK